MPAPRIRADYDMLKVITRLFQQEQRASNQTMQRLKRTIGTLRGGEWIGKGATEFYREMNSEVMPSVQRLTRSLEAASRVTRQISQIMRQAEDECARILRSEGDGAGSRPGTGGAGAGAGGGASGGQGGGSGASSFAGARASSEGSVGDGDSDGFWSNGDWKFGGNLWEFEASEGGKFSPGIGVKYGVEGAFFGDPSEDGVSAFGGEIGFGAGFGKDGFTIGPYGEVYAAKGQTSGRVGDSDLGLTGGAGFKALSLDGFMGIKDNSFGASVGGNLASVEGTGGVDVAGYHVGVSGELGLKAELGFSIGQHTEIKLPFVSFGFNFGSAEDDVPIMKTAVEAIRSSHPHLMRN